MTIAWSAAAEQQLLDYLDYLAERDPEIARRAKRDIIDRVRVLGRRPRIGRKARWPDLHEFSLTRWRKIVVYRVEPDRVLIVAIYDARQDLTKAKPKPSK